MRLELTSDYVATCFQDRLLIRPDDFRPLLFQAAEVGIEPTASWFRARRHYQQQLFRIDLLNPRHPPHVRVRELGEKGSNLHSLLQRQAAYH